MLIVPLIAALILLVATLVHVYRGGRTLNDHAVAAVVSGCMAVYPLLWVGARGAGVSGAAQSVLGAALALGAVGIWGIFFVLDRRVQARLLMPLAWLSQPAYAFSLWAGLLLCVWIPGALLAGWLGWGELPVLWPGRWLLLPLGLSVWGTAWTYGRHARVRRVSLRAGVSAPRRPLRIVHLSDLHASPVMTGPHLQLLVDRTNALKPDLVAITGDLLMPFSERRHGYLLDALAGLVAPTVLCPGNHDLPVAETLAAELRALGMTWLADGQTLLDLSGARVAVLGLDFRWKNARTAADAVLARLPPPPDPVDLRLLLVHDPRHFAWIPDERFDLVLSGHTHGGQVGTDMFGLPWSVLRLFGVFDQGLFTRGRTQLYVHRGCWHTGLPPRMGIAAEVVALDVSAR